MAPPSESTPNSSSTPAIGLFQWGGTISVLVLLLVTARRNRKNFLLLYLLISVPSPFFQSLRGQFGRWISFLAVGAHVFFPETFTVARFVLFVITPSWLIDGLRDSQSGGVFCLCIGLFLLIEAILDSVRNRRFECDLTFFIYLFALCFMLFFTFSSLVW